MNRIVLAIFTLLAGVAFAQTLPELEANRDKLKAELATVERQITTMAATQAATKPAIIAKLESMPKAFWPGEVGDASMRKNAREKWLMENSRNIAVNVQVKFSKRDESAGNIELWYELPKKASIWGQDLPVFFVATKPETFAEKALQIERESVFKLSGKTANVIYYSDEKWIVVMVANDNVR